MAKIKITCDSASDLPPGLAQRYRIDILPLSIAMGSELRRDRIDVDLQDAADFTCQTGQLPRIEAVSSEAYRRAFSALTAQGWEVIHICMSGAISQCYRHAVQAAEGFPGVSVIDSRSISAGAGQLALLAADLAGADYRADEVVEAVEELKQKLEVSFLIQSPEYYRRGCRPGGLAAQSERMLKLKPEIILKKGSLRRGLPLRGDQETTILTYVKRALGGRKNIQTDRIFVTYSDLPRTTIEKVKALLKQLQPFEEILEAPASSVVSGRWGPGCLGLSFLTC